MSLNLRGVHVFERIPNSGMYRMKEAHPAMRLTDQADVVFIQDGMVYDAGGRRMPLKQIPGWFAGAVESANPVALREAGWKGMPKE